jgi:DHA1 family bicyclomycin/chloramphenicol resistance-like MFS transporter
MKRHSFGFTLLLALVSGVSSLGVDMGLPAMPVIERHFILLSGRGSLTLSVFLAGFAMAPLFGGPLSDRFGRRPVLIGALIAYALAAFGCAATPNFATLLVSRVLQGSAAGVCVSLPLAIIRDSLDGQAARNSMSQVTTVLGVVPVLAPVTGAWVLLVSDWRGIYAVQAGLALLLMVAVCFTFSETLDREKRQAFSVRTLLHNYHLLIFEKEFLVHAFVYSLAFACLFAYVSASPLVLMGRMHVREQIYTLLFACTAGSQMLGAFFSGLLTRRHVAVTSVIRRGLVILIGAALTGLALQVTGLARPIFVMPPTMLCLFSFGFLAPSLTVGALEPIPHIAGAGSGAIRSLQCFLGAGTSAVLAWICARPSVDPAIAMVAMMAVAAVLAFGLYFGSGMHTFVAGAPEEPARLT